MHRLLLLIICTCPMIDISYELQTFKRATCLLYLSTPLKIFFCQKHEANAIKGNWVNNISDDLWISKWIDKGTQPICLDFSCPIIYLENAHPRNPFLCITIIVMIFSFCDKQIFYRSWILFHTNNSMIFILSCKRKSTILNMPVS